MNHLFEVFWRFLVLGCVSFGGPAAHIGYFQKVFVQKLNWLGEDEYAKLITLSQFLPGPGSSQIGFSIGLRRAGVLGGLVAFIGFTLPSFILLYFLAILSVEYTASSLFLGVVNGLKLLAVIVVADATFNMSKAFCKNRLSIGIATLTAVIMLIVPSVWMQMIVLMLAATIGVFFGNRAESQPKKTGRIHRWPFVLFILIFGVTLFVFKDFPMVSIFSDFYRVGSLVFGGGHVVLPLLQQVAGDTISSDQFIVGYAAAQGVPGPMFSLAAFLGAEMLPLHPLLGALIATIAVFLPGFLLILSLQDAWQKFAVHPKISGASWGVNAAVVGLLLSALYQPIFVSSVSSAMDLSLVILGFFALRVLNIPVVVLVAGFTLTGLMIQT